MARPPEIEAAPAADPAETARMWTRLAPAVIALTLSVALVYWLHLEAVAARKVAIGENLAGIARTISASFDGAAFEQMFAAEGSDPIAYELLLRRVSRSGEYERMRDALRATVVAHHRAMGITPEDIVTFARDPHDATQLRWAVMPRPDAFFPGEIYAPRPEMLAVLSGEEPSSFTDVYRSSASSLERISGYAPIRGQEGDIVGVIDVSLDVATVLRETREAGQTALFAMVVIVLVGLLAAFGLWRVAASLRNRTLALLVSEAALRTARDEAERARAQAEEASKAKSIFLANMSHELRTPLNAIIGYSEMLAEDAADAGNDALLEDVKKITGAGRHLLSLINDILDLSKIEAGKMEVYVETVDVAQLFEEVVHSIEHLAAANGTAVRTGVSGDVGTIESDATKVRQILFNLLSNASKFTKSGEIDTRAAREDGGVVFTVRDSGIGMSAAHLATLFQEFTQADATTTKKYGGTGLGMAITGRFVEMLGGRIEVESALGEGTTFRVWLPPSPAVTAGADVVVTEEALAASDATE